jgi:hypothetical protein
MEDTRLGPFGPVSGLDTGSYEVIHLGGQAAVGWFRRVIAG